MFNEYLPVAADVFFRTGIIYILMIAGIIFLGKKELSQLSIVDLVFILLISNSVQNAMVGEHTSIEGGIISAGTLFLLNYILKRLMFRFGRLHRLLSGDPVLLIHEGKMMHRNCEKQRITEDELKAAVREHGIKDIKDVDMAVLETDGNISVVSYDHYRKTKYIRKSKRPSLSREH